jgi:hypothetical protein
MKKLLLLLAVVVGLNVAFYHKNIMKYIAYNFVYKYEVIEYEIKGYPKKGNYHFIKETSDFYPKNKQDILNIIYTAINNGWHDFSFICDYDYDQCESDMTDLSKNSEHLAIINNYVHPFNSYDRLNITINGLGKIRIEVKPLYTEQQINEINLWVDNVLETKIKDTMSIRTKLLTIHDYIIDRSVYDKERSNAIKDGIEMNGNYSHIAYGIIKDNKAVCGGYTDLMSIFLEKLNIPNFKVSTDDHIWNLVYYNDQWLHMDLTWDDPYTGTSENIKQHYYFLITTERLWKLDVEQHLFDVEIFKEAQ